MIKKYPGWAVVAAWGLFNAVLVAVLVVYHEHIIPVALYAGSVILIEAAAVAILVSARRGGDVQQRQRLAVRGALALPFMAVGFTLVLLTLPYGPWMLSLAVPLLLVACALAFHRGAWRKDTPS